MHAVVRPDAVHLAATATATWGRWRLTQAMQVD